MSLIYTTDVVIELAPQEESPIFFIKAPVGISPGVPEQNDAELIAGPYTKLLLLLTERLPYSVDLVQGFRRSESWPPLMYSEKDFVIQVVQEFRALVGLRVEPTGLGDVRGNHQHNFVTVFERPLNKRRESQSSAKSLTQHVTNMFSS